MFLRGLGPLCSRPLKQNFSGGVQNKLQFKNQLKVQKQRFLNFLIQSMMRTSSMYKKLMHDTVASSLAATVSYNPTYYSKESAVLYFPVLSQWT